MKGCCFPLCPFPLSLSPSSPSSLCSGRLRDQLPQHVGENPPVAVVLDLNRRIYAERDRHFLHLAALAADDERQVLSRLDLDLLQADEVEGLRAVEVERLRAHALLELA